MLISWSGLIAISLPISYPKSTRTGLCTSQTVHHLFEHLNEIRHQAYLPYLMQWRFCGPRTDIYDDNVNMQSDS